jgi:photosystem II stability/assembly factor-like uncharacterized protein
MPINLRMTFLHFSVVLLFLCGATVKTAAQQSAERWLYASFYFAPPPANVSKAAPVYQGLAVSSDRGESWSSRGWITSSVNAISVDPTDPRHLVLATDYGVLHSTDAGENWKQISNWDMPAVLDVHLAADMIWAATSEGVFQSTDGGARWRVRNVGLPSPDGTYATALLALPGSMMLATNDGIFRSTDQGESWVRSGLDRASCSGLRAHPKDQSHIAAWSQQEGIWISTDGGRSWINRNGGIQFPFVKCAAFDPRDRGTILIGTQRSGVLRSTNLGENWELSSGGLTNFNITALLFDPDQPERVYAGAENGSFISDTRGKTWQPFSVRLGYVSDLWMQ